MTLTETLLVTSIIFLAIAIFTIQQLKKLQNIVETHSTKK